MDLWTRVSQSCAHLSTRRHLSRVPWMDKRWSAKERRGHRIPRSNAFPWSARTLSSSSWIFSADRRTGWGAEEQQNQSLSILPWRKGSALACGCHPVLDGRRIWLLARWNCKVLTGAPGQNHWRNDTKENNSHGKRREPPVDNDWENGKPCENRSVFPAIGCGAFIAGRSRHRSGIPAKGSDL